MSRLAAAAFLILLASPRATAQEWFPVGSGTLGPAPGLRHVIRAATNPFGSLATWTDSRNDGIPFVYIARLDPQGLVLDPEGIPLGQGGNAVVATDGEAFLVVRPGDALYATRVTREGVQPALRIAGSGFPTDLVWNGRHYVLVLESSEVLLLERDGTPASGAIRFPFRPIGIACRSERCFAAYNGGNETRYAGFFSLSAFPPRGSGPVDMTLPPFAGERLLAVGMDARGIYTISGREQTLTLRYHVDSVPAADAPRRFRHRALNAGSRSFTVPRFGFPFVTTYSEGDALYIAYRDAFEGKAVVVRTAPSGVTAFAPPVPAVAREPWLTEGGLLLWIDLRHNSPQVYAAPLRGDAWNSGGRLVSGAQARELMPRLERGTLSWLAAWVERRDLETIYVSTLDRDGRTLTAPAALDGGFHATDDLAIGFDGVNFLVAWRSRIEPHPVRGRLVSRNGVPLGEPFTIAPQTGEIGTPLQVLWNGVHYVVLPGSRFVRVTSSGAVLDVLPPPRIYLDPAYVLAYDPATGGFWGLETIFSPSRIAVGPGYRAAYSIRALDTALAPAGPGTEDLDTAYEVAPAVAAGGGHRLAIVHSWWDNALRVAGSGPRDWLPYAPPRLKPGEWPFGLKGLRAIWSGREFVVVSGPTLARHAPDGAFRDMRTLGSYWECALAPADPTAVLVLCSGTAAIETIEARRVELTP